MSNLPAPIVAGLTSKQIAFAENFVRLGGRNASGAAAMAGYSTAGNGHQAIASRLLRHPDVLALIRHLVLTDVQAGAATSMDTLKQLRDDPAVPAEVRRKCANDLLAQAGFLVEKFATVRHVVSDTREGTARAVETYHWLREHAEACGMAIVDQAKWDEALRCARITDERDKNDAVVIDGEVLEEEEEDAADGHPGLEDVI
jgi:hypothetical protein